MARGRRTPSKKERRQRQEWRESEQEFQAERQAMGQCLAGLYNVSEEEGRSHVELVDAQPDCMLVDSLSTLLGEKTRDYRRAAASLDRVLEEYKKWMGEVNAHPVARRILENRLDADVLDDVGETGESREPREHPDDILTTYSLHSVTIDLCKNMDRLAQWGLNYIHELGQRAARLELERGPDVAGRYLADVLREVEKETQGHLIRFAVKSARSRERTLSRTIIDYPEIYQAAFQRIDPLTPSYLDLGGKQGIRILNSLPENGTDHLEKVKRVSERIRQLSIQHADLELAAAVVHSTGEDQRWDVLEQLCAHPTALPLYRTLRKTQLPASEYARFVLEEANLRSLQTGRTLLDIVSDLAATPSQAKAAAFLITNGPDILLDEQAPALLTLSATYPLADIVLKEYLAAVRAGEQHKAAFLLAVGQARPSSEQLREARGIIREVPDEQLSWAATCDVPEQEALTRLRRYKSQPSPPLPPRPARERPDWFTVMLRSLESEGATRGLQDGVREAYGRLPPHDRRLLRKVWTSQPEALQAFSEDVLALDGTAAYQVILRDRELFAGYLDRLKAQDGFREELRELALPAEAGNLYRDLGQLLRRDAPASPPPPPIPDVESLPALAPRGRLIVWGGQYSREAKERIASAVDLPIQVYDMFNRRRDVQGIGPDDVVICVTTSMSHADYPPLKYHCRNVGAGFYHFNRSGLHSLIGFLQQKFSSSKSA